jgi:hypothetical protein
LYKLSTSPSFCFALAAATGAGSPPPIGPVQRVAGERLLELFDPRRVLGAQPNRVDAFQVRRERVNPRLVRRVVVGDQRKLAAVQVAVLVNGQADLPHVVGALAAAGGGARRLHRRQQERHQRADDGDHHQQLDQGKPSAQAHSIVLAPRPRPAGCEKRRRHLFLRAHERTQKD